MTTNEQYENAVAELATLTTTQINELAEDLVFATHRLLERRKDFSEEITSQVKSAAASAVRFRRTHNPCSLVAARKGLRL